MPPRIIGLEGGPCSGKTTALEHIKVEGIRLGREIITISETATEMIHELGALGLHISEVQAYRRTRLGFQKELQRRNMQKLQDAVTLANDDAIIVHDRPDNSAYAKPEEHAQICRELGFDYNPTHIFIGKLLYLRSLAWIAPDRYEELKSSNTARFETVEQARTQCEANYQAVKNHPNIHVIAEPSLPKMLHKVTNLVLAEYDENFTKSR